MRFIRHGEALRVEPSVVEWPLVGSVELDGGFLLLAFNSEPGNEHTNHFRTLEEKGSKLVETDSFASGTDRSNTCVFLARDDAGNWKIGIPVWKEEPAYLDPSERSVTHRKKTYRQHSRVSRFLRASSTEPQAQVWSFCPPFNQPYPLREPWPSVGWVGVSKKGFVPGVPPNGSR